MAPVINGFPNYLVAFAAAIVIALVTGAVWLGKNSNQIDVNTGRLSVIEQKIDKLRDDDAEALAQTRSIERRLDRLEGPK